MEKGESEMSVLDIGKNHEAKIIRKELAVPPLSGYNHLAIFMKWAYINGMLRDEVLKEPDFIKGVTGECDLREVLANSSFFNGVIRTDYFAIEYRDFVEGVYGIGCSGPYPGQVDKNAEEYFGREMYRSEELADEAYLFVPYDSTYYANLSRFLDAAWLKYKNVLLMAQQKREEQENKASIGKEKLDYILDIIKKQTATEAVILRLEEGEADFTGSKVGGYPYWPKNMAYPEDSNHNPLVLMAQINLSDFSIDQLPGSGLLQFFIARDDCLGLYDGKGYKVIYHKTIDPGITEEGVKRAGIKSNQDYIDQDDGWLPTSKCIRLSCRVQTDYLKAGLPAFDETVEKILREKYHYDLQDKCYWEFLSKEDCRYLEGEDDAGVHKMFGYPFFTQDDPRDSGEELFEKYDTLLFQLDSEFNRKNREYDILIGDSGVMNFFINSGDLKNLNFDDVLYHWDCC